MSDYSEQISRLEGYSLDVRYSPDFVFTFRIGDEEMNIAPDLAGPLLMALHETKQIVVYYNKVTTDMISGIREIVEEYYELFDETEHSLINDWLNTAMEHPEFLDKLLKILIKIGEAFFVWLVGISSFQSGLID